VKPLREAVDDQAYSFSLSLEQFKINNTTDGSRHGDGLHISTYNFSNEDIDKLIYTLQDKFGLKCSIHFNRDNKPRIYIFKESMDKLRSLVSQYFIKEMLYKLGL